MVAHFHSPSHIGGQPTPFPPCVGKKPSFPDENGRVFGGTGTSSSRNVPDKPATSNGNVLM